MISSTSPNADFVGSTVGSCVLMPPVVGRKGVAWIGGRTAEAPGNVLLMGGLLSLKLAYSGTSSYRGGGNAAGICAIPPSVSIRIVSSGWTWLLINKRSSH